MDRLAKAVAFTTAAGVVLLVIGFCTWAALIGVEPDMALVVIGMVLNGVGVGLVFPALMATSTQALPPTSFATGAGLINMLRQAAIAIGVAIFVAIIGSPDSVQERLRAFQVGWAVMAAITLCTLLPLVMLVRRAPEQ